MYPQCHTGVFSGSLHEIDHSDKDVMMPYEASVWRSTHLKQHIGRLARKNHLKAIVWGEKKVSNTCKSFYIDLSADELQHAGEGSSTEAHKDTFQTHLDVALNVHTCTCW